MGLMDAFFCVMIFATTDAALLTLNPVAAEVDIDLSCGKLGISNECGIAIGRKVAQNQEPPTTNDCCAQLIKIGKACHDSYTQAYIKINNYVGTVVDLLKRSDEEWSHCVNAVGLFRPAVASSYLADHTLEL